MKQVEQGSGDLTVRFESDYNDEVAQVGFRFNRMLGEIGSLVEEIKLVEQEKRKQEVKALQSQIDPHFLYNTLNTIYWKSEMNDHEDVREMIISLSNLFRLGVNNGHDMTSLDKELTHVEHYLLLQKKNYKRLYSYEIQVADPSLKERRVPKVILQPLVENTILHGFKDMDADGRIRLTVDADESFLLLEVEDNGSGMDVERTRERMLAAHTSEQGYALRNVYQRLKLIYGAAAEVELRSRPYKLTTVAIKIPIQGELG
jgi:two-component system sensor histidine kinase YesM